MGKTNLPHLEWCRYQKHPHGRGEDLKTAGCPVGREETPPRAWGRRRGCRGVHVPLRNTPTGVGKTQSQGLPQTLIQKHPHGRGEDVMGMIRWHCQAETPPRAWGRRATTASDAISNRNTPTGVGKTVWVLGDDNLKGKHPHGRGEDLNRLLILRRLTETPPRAWGRPPAFQNAIGTDRNTPTGVGKTRHGEKLGRIQRKHPHGRGEDLSFYNPIGCNAETPPRAWGRRAFDPIPGAGQRNTPTGVGKTILWQKVIIYTKKHPHGRGED